MSHFQSAYDDPYQHGTSERKTSGMAITALVLSLIGIIPCCGVITAPIGAILGLVSFVSIGSNPQRKGRGIAMAALVLGTFFTIVQVVGLSWVWRHYAAPAMQLMMDGPTTALNAGFAGDTAGFKSQFHGPGAAASDAEAQSFIESLRSRYGEFSSAELRQQARPSTGRGNEIMQYVVHFTNGQVDAEVEIMFVDPQTGGFVGKLGYIIVRDAQAGDLVYPPGTTP